ncbi:MAG TPA: endonuclease/exonuclease/phosphatase family protein [Pseudobdellovibrionaceae bacterium]|nr:endonuclease/exonuclease/phosphatase family protein [Pseudobdellovibrionaceae bacterium]
MKRLLFVLLIFFVGPGFAQESVVQSWGKNPRALPGSSVRELTWNIQKANGDEEWSRVFRQLSASSDLVFGQEGYLTSLFDRTMRETPSFLWIFATSFRYLGKDTGVFFGSRYHAEAMRWHRSPGREPGTFTPKMSISALFPLKDGRRLMTVNTHGLNFVLDRHFQGQMIPLFQTIEAHQGPVIFAGDFNTWNRSRFDFLVAGIKRLGMGGVGFADDRRRMKIDHVFYRGLTVQEAFVRTDINTSDHWPLKATFGTGRTEAGPQFIIPELR